LVHFGSGRWFLLVDEEIGELQEKDKSNDPDVSVSGTSTD